MMLSHRLKRVLLFLLLTSITLVISSCSGKTPESDSINSPSERTALSTPIPTQTPLPLVPSPTPFTCQDYQESVVLLVEEAYLEQLQDSLDQFSRDLCEDNYQVIIAKSNFESPEQIREYLKDLYFEKTAESLAGAILIGDIPYAYQHVTLRFSSPDIPPKYQEFISLQFYADLDGEFFLSAEYQPANGEAPLGEPIFDTHQGETDWEIWVSVMPPYLGEQDSTIDALQRYFERNHAYRTGQIDLPRAYIHIQGYQSTTMEEYEEFLEACLGGTLDWTALKGDSEPQIFFGNEAMGLTDTAGYQAISEFKADFSIFIGHGNVGSVGQINNPWLEENQLATIFFWSHSCSVGNLDNQYHILSQILYHPNSLVLFTTGNTTEAMGLGTNINGPYPRNISTALSRGLSIGEAILLHVNTPLVQHEIPFQEKIFGSKIFYGDLTLKIRE